jgi:hypothetical protein
MNDKVYKLWVLNVYLKSAVEANQVGVLNLCILVPASGCSGFRLFLSRRLDLPSAA